MRLPVPRSRFLALAIVLLLQVPLSAHAEEFLPGVHRIIFLGDSITYAGNYVDDFEAWLFIHHPDQKIEVIDLGLPSETVSGLSEEGHAGGKFPRPDLHERLARVLEKTKPDLVFACYGMNDGIYLPLSEERFGKFQDGMEWLHREVTAAGAQIIHLTPAAFDVTPIQARTSEDGAHGFYNRYDDVLTRYSEWLLEQRARGWRVIDIHAAMRKALDEHRQTEPEFSFTKDGVHPNPAGHHVIATALLEGLGQHAEFPTTQKYSEYLSFVRKRGRLLADAWLNACGHKRPGMAKGLPVEEAEAKAAELREQILAERP